MVLAKDIEVDKLTLLKDNELKQLCFFAYHGEDAKLVSGSEYRKAIKVSKKSYEDAIDRFNELGFILGKSYVKQQWHILILKELYRNHAEWIKEFKPIYPLTRNSVAEYLCNIVKMIVAGDYVGAAKIRRPYEGIGYKQFNLLKYLGSVDEEDLRFIRLMNDHEVNDMVKELLEVLFVKDDLTKEILQMLKSLVSDRKAQQKELLAEIEGYSFLMHGTSIDETSYKTVWTESIKAVRLLYKGQLEASVESFEDALRLVSKSRRSFDNPILNYAYGIALYKMSKKGVNNYESKLTAFLGDKNIRFKDSNYSIRQLLESIDGKSNYLDSTLPAHESKGDKVQESLLFILNSFLEKTNDSVITRKLHSSAFLQHEMSAYLKMNNSTTEKYETLFGGKPLISTLRRKSKWEIAFQEIEASVSKLCEREKRIAYYVNGYDLEAIVEQTKEEDGWRDGQVLSLSQMIKYGYDSMDSKDTIVASGLSESGKYEGAAKIVVPIMADSNRLFHGTHYDGRRSKVTVLHEQPCLAFSGNGDAITVSSNVKLSEDGNIPKYTLTSLGKGEYKLVTVNPFQKDVVKKFMILGNIPSTAAVSLKKAIKSLNGIVDVKDGDLDTLLKPAAMSKGLIAVRITPKKNEYAVSLMASAMEDGRARFSPAEGGSLVYDEVDNITHTINRDLNKERENYDLLMGYMEDELMCEFDFPTETTVYSAESLLHLLAYVYDNQDRFFVEWPEGRPLHFKGDVRSGDITVNVKSETEWFTMDGKVTTNTLNLTLEALIRSCCGTQIEGFVKISDEEYIRMSEELKRHIAALDSLSAKKDRKRVIPKFQVGALASMIRNLRFKEDGGYTDFMERTREAYNVNPDVPKTLNAKLRDYQVEGFRWICRLSAWGAGACLADDMGLGKTIQAITFLLHKASEGPSLVIAPKSILPNWENEIARFAPTLQCINLNTEKNRWEAVDNAREADVILCTYGILGTEEYAIKNKKWNVVCLDEAHTIKNRNTIASRVAMDLIAASRLILTGTPLQNNLSELWNLFQFINPGLLGTWSVFRDSFMIPSLDREHRDLLKEMTMPFILRRRKQDVLTELPEKIISEKKIDLTDNEQRVYEEMRRRAEVKFKDYKTRAERSEAKTLDINFFTELMHLREAACSMKLVFDEWTEKSSKLIALMEILDTLMSDDNNNVIVFSQFTSFLDLIKPELKQRKMPFLYLDGQTPLNKRKQYVDDFQSGKCRLFLSSLKAGGFGINLTQANYVILLDPWWNPSVENQAMDRAHRIGQKRVVTVIRLVSAQTIEEKILNLHKEKQKLTDDILEGTGESSKLTYEDVMDMVSPF